MVDVLCADSPSAGSRVHAEVRIRAGGTAVNAAIAAAEAGAAATVVGRVGSDDSAALVSAALAERNVAGKLARDPELPTGAAVALGPSVVAHRGANERLSPEDIPDPLEGDALLVSGFALFQHGSAAAAEVALERFGGRWAAVDTASPKLAAQARVERLAMNANVILATADEAQALTGNEPAEAARGLASHFEIACVKLGEEGAIAAQGDRVEHVAAERVVRRSTFGAGDAFAGALLVALAREDPLERALRIACEAGASAGATSPWRDSPSRRTASSP
jgi:sugar/nucleoside kinase (ribokinase family)